MSFELFYFHDLSPCSLAVCVEAAFLSLSHSQEACCCCTESYYLVIETVAFAAGQVYYYPDVLISITT